MTRRTRKRPIWLIAIAAGFAAALLIRVAIAIENAAQTPENPLGLTGWDALLIGAFLALIGMVPIVLWVNRASSRLLAAVRCQFAGHPVYLTTVLPHLVEEVQRHEVAPGLTENTAAAVVFSEYECGWWRNARRPVRVGAVISDVPIAYSIGTTEHFGRCYHAIVAKISVKGQEHSIPIGLISETSRRFLASWAVDEELQMIEAELQSI